MSYVIALDIGGTKIEGAIVSKQGAISHTKKIYIYENDSKNKILNNIIYVIQFLKHITSFQIKAVGISFSGIINNQGILISQGNKLDCLNGINIKKKVQEKVNLPVIIENDANCFALAENIYGKYKNHNSLVGVIWGTSIGGGIIINKELFKGAQNSAGEIGRVKIPIQLNDDKKHLFEIGHICGGKYIQHNYSNKTTLPSKILTTNTPEAKKISKIVVSTMAWMLSNIVNTINPEVIVLGGGVSETSNTIYLKIQKEMKKYCDPYLYKHLKLKKYSIRNDAGILGASYLAFKL